MGIDEKGRKGKLKLKKERYRCRYCNKKLGDRGDLILHESDHYNPNSLEIRRSSPVPLNPDVSDSEWSPLKSTMHPNARHGVELSDQEFDTLVGARKKKKKDPVFDSLLKKKKRSKKEKKEKKKRKNEKGTCRAAAKAR